MSPRLKLKIEYGEAAKKKRSEIRCLAGVLLLMKGRFLLNRHFRGFCTTSLGSALLLVLSASCFADDRYLGILHHNPFRLVAPSPPVTADPAPPPEPAPTLSNLQLSGISSGPDGQFAWVVLPAEAGQRTNAHYLKLSIGDRQEGILVVGIDQPRRTVTVNQHGQVRTLSLDSDAPPVMAATALVPRASHQARELVRQRIERAQRAAAARRTELTTTVRQVNQVQTGTVVAPIPVRSGLTLAEAHQQGLQPIGIGPDGIQYAPIDDEELPVQE